MYSHVSAVNGYIYAHVYIDATSPQPTASKFPPEGTELGEGAIPLPGVSWSAMQPHGSRRLLSLPLWLSLQYLGKWEFCMCYHIAPKIGSVQFVLIGNLIQQCLLIQVPIRICERKFLVQAQSA